MILDTLSRIFSNHAQERLTEREIVLSDKQQQTIARALAKRQGKTVAIRLPKCKSKAGNKYDDGNVPVLVYRYDSIETCLYRRESQHFGKSDFNVNDVIDLSNID